MRVNFTGFAQRQRKVLDNLTNNGLHQGIVMEVEGYDYLSVEELLEKIKSGEAVDEALIPGHIKTPRIPDSVFTIVKKPNGAKPGMVIYTTNKTIFVNPTEEIK